MTALITQQKIKNTIQPLSSTVHLYFNLVGATRFELATSSTPRKRSTKLSHAPNTNIIVSFFTPTVNDFNKKDYHNR